MEKDRLLDVDGDSSESQENLASTIPCGLLAMVLVVIILLRSLR
jgi:hypothetical protein